MVDERYKKGKEREEYICFVILSARCTEETAVIPAWGWYFLFTFATLFSPQLLLLLL